MERTNEKALNILQNKREITVLGSVLWFGLHRPAPPNP